MDEVADMIGHVRSSTLPDEGEWPQAGAFCKEPTRLMRLA